MLDDVVAVLLGQTSKVSALLDWSVVAAHEMQHPTLELGCMIGCGHVDHPGEVEARLLDRVLDFAVNGPAHTRARIQ